MVDILARPLPIRAGFYLDNGQPRHDASWPGRAVAGEVGTRAWGALQAENRGRR